MTLLTWAKSELLTEALTELLMEPIKFISETIGCDSAVYMTYISQKIRLFR